MTPSYNTIGSALDNQIGQYPAKPSMPERAPQITVALDLMEKELGALQDSLQRLEQRLGPVMSLEGPQKAGDIQANEPTCPIAAQIQRLSRSVSMASSAVMTLVRRVEV